MPIGKNNILLNFISFFNSRLIKSIGIVNNKPNKGYINPSKAMVKRFLFGRVWLLKMLSLERRLNIKS